LGGVFFVFGGGDRFPLLTFVFHDYGRLMCRGVKHLIDCDKRSAHGPSALALNALGLAAFSGRELYKRQSRNQDHDNAKNDFQLLGWLLSAVSGRNPLDVAAMLDVCVAS
jgi:hypothetical protein